MRISFSCKTAWVKCMIRSKIPRVEKTMDLPKKAISICQAWCRNPIVSRIGKSTQRMMAFRICRFKRRNNTTGFTWIALRKLLKWWGSSISQHPSWDSISKICLNNNNNIMMRMLWILNNSREINTLVMNKTSQGQENIPTWIREALTGSLSLFSQEVGSLKPILFIQTWILRNQLTFTTTLVIQNWTWFTRTPIWCSKYKTNHSPQRMPMEPGKNSIKMRMAITVKLGVMLLPNSPLTSQEEL